MIALLMISMGAPVYVAGFAVFALLLILWHFFRNQVVEVSDQSIAVWDDLFGIRLEAKRYLAGDIRELRVSAAAPARGVAFDYGSATMAFGSGLDAAGAAEIVAEITRRFPQYQRKQSDARAQPERRLYESPSAIRGPSQVIQAPPPRHSSEFLGSTLRITIPSPKQWSGIIFFAVWVTFWSIIGGGVLALPAIGSIVGGQVDVGLSILAIYWALGEIAGICHLLWQLVGKEEIEITPDSITIRQTILGIGRPKVYLSEHVSRMRSDAAGAVQPYPLARMRFRLNRGTGIIGFGYLLRYIGFGYLFTTIIRGTGIIAFDYMGRTIRVGIGVHEAEAKQLLAEIQRLYPRYVAQGRREKQQERTSRPSPAAKAAFCSDCLWRSGDTCTAAESPVSGQRCEPVCSGQVVCPAALTVAMDARPVSRQPLDGAELFRVFMDPGITTAEIAGLGPLTLSRRVASWRRTQAFLGTVREEVSDLEIALAILAYAREDAARPEMTAGARRRPAAQTLSCPRCGSENPPGTVFCTSCGAAVLAVEAGPLE